MALPLLRLAEMVLMEAPGNVVMVEAVEEDQEHG